MAEANWEAQRQHYNSHVKDLSTREALQQRSEGPAQELKHFHNHVKRQLLWRFCWRTERLLDMCCGRGGDLHKWRDCQIRYVKGLDISEREVDEARRRYAELHQRFKQGQNALQCEFEACDSLGAEHVIADPSGTPFSAITCMFALHYFFVTEHSLRTFLQNVADNLKPGGYFIGTIPMGPRVEELLGKRPELRTPMLRLVRKWKDHSSPFGRGYICDIADTVTSATDASAGSLEYLVGLDVLEAAAADAGLFPVRDYQEPILSSNFEQEDLDAPFKRFKPFFPNSLALDVLPGRPLPQPPSSLELASSLFCAFVFQKTSGPDAVTLPITPECSYMQPPGGGRRQGAGGWGGEEGGGMGHGRGPPHQGGHGGGPGGHFDGPQGYAGGPGPGGYGGGGKRPAEGFPYGPGGGGPGDPNKRPYHGQGAYG